MRIDRSHDVLVVGCGPTGATLAGLLGRLGVRTAVLERSREVFAQPRAVGFDHDAMRLFQRIGVADRLAPHVAPFRDAVYFGCDGRVIQRSRALRPPYPFTWAPNYTCDQPGLESVLRDALVRMPSVELALGCEVQEVDVHDDRVVALVRDGHGGLQRWSARFAVACDGAASPLRRSLGIGLESLDYDEPWIVVDMKVGPDALARLPDTNVQYCEPQRPCTYVVCPGDHRRWEFMRLAGEPAEGALDEARLWALLARWLRPGEATLWRAAAYRFHALVATRWRSGPVLLAGDAAHQTPPFLGQGMCQGLRDAGNLAWKLAMTLQGRAAPGLLDTYAQERRPHVLETTRIAKELGLLISERDPQRALARDAALLARGGGEAPTLIRQQLIPGLADGLLATGTPLAGQAFVQPRVTGADAREQLLDDVTAPGFRVVVDPTGDGEALRRAARTHGLPVVVVARRDDAPAGVEAAGVTRVTEHDALLHDTFERAGVHGAVVRPDHTVYGAFTDAAAGAALVAALARTAFAAAPPGAIHPIPIPEVR